MNLWQFGTWKTLNMRVMRWLGASSSSDLRPRPFRRIPGVLWIWCPRSRWGRKVHGTSSSSSQGLDWSVNIGLSSTKHQYSHFHVVSASGSIAKGHVDDSELAASTSNPGVVRALAVAISSARSPSLYTQCRPYEEHRRIGTPTRDEAGIGVRVLDGGRVIDTCCTVAALNGDHSGLR